MSKRMTDYKHKYYKYKHKYLTLKNGMIGGSKDSLLTFDRLFTAETPNQQVKDDWYNAWNKMYYVNNNQVRLNRPSTKLSDLKNSVKYAPNQGIITNNLHDGQRKLFLSEIQFLTNCLSSHLEQKVVVYVGAAPSMKAYFALRYFPNLVWILIDPNPFKIMTKPHYHKYNRYDKIKFISSEQLDDSFIKELDKYSNSKIKKPPKDANILVINELFTDKLANTLSKISNMLFISDIRTNVKETKHPVDLDIIWNLSQQWLWIIKMNCSYSLLKFRHPYYLEADSVANLSPDLKQHFNKVKDVTKIDFIENYKKKKLVYVKGDVFLQMYAPITSLESRLFVKQGDLTINQNYGNLDLYEDKFVYFNKVKRSYLVHENKYLDRALGFDQCQDCAACAQTWEGYINKYNLEDKTTPLEEVKRYQKFFGRSLIKNGHGMLFDRLTQGFIDRTVEKGLSYK